MGGTSGGGSSGNTGGGGLLGAFLTGVEWVGNKLPNPVMLFILATVLIIGLSAVGTGMQWSVQPQRPKIVMEQATDATGAVIERKKLDATGRPVIELVDDGAPVSPRSVLTSDGIYWLTANLVRNFINFAPLGVVLVSMFGIGVAEKVGLFGAFMRAVASVVSSRMLTPTVIFLGVISNTASDAGYIILPPLAAGLYAVFKRPPLAGIAAAFAGVAGGFSANLLIASTDALVAPLTERGAQVLDPSYSVLVTCNWWFLAASTFLLPVMGWAVTAWIVEPRLARQQQENPIVDPVGVTTDQSLSPKEKKGLWWALVGVLASVGIIVGSIAIPGAPLHGTMPAASPAYGPIPLAWSGEGAFTPAGEATRGPTKGTLNVKPGVALDAGWTANEETVRGTFRTSQGVEVEGRFEPASPLQPRWSQAIVPFIFVAFLIPGLAYGLATGTIKKAGDVATAFIHSMSTMAPIIAMAFFAAQFIECFKFSQLDRMLAFAGGKTLVSLGLPTPLLLVGVIVLVMIVNILMSSMSAKWTALAPILVPMMMMAGLSPELTQLAYRVGDSVTNCVTPLNTYIIVVLVAVQRYKPDAGLGSLIAMMVPYSIIFAIIWTAFLLAWVALGIPIGPSAPLWYAPGH